MVKASVTVSADFVLSDIDRRIFGNFIEQMGRQVLGGIYEPGHPTADEKGFRHDVIDLVKELGVTIVRYPGGNILSGYNWKNGIGPREERPRTLCLSRFTIETHQVGTNEFIEWCKLADVEPMLAINLESEGFDSAREYVEYCNHKGGSQWSDLRIEHGYTEPHKVKVWCLGNEPDGHWQIAAHSAETYARIATETAKAIKWIDPNTQLTLAPAAARSMPYYGEWERIVLEDAFDYVDFICPHMYFKDDHKDTSEYLAWADQMNGYIKEMVAMCDAVAGKKRSRKRIMISFDEWNIGARWPIEEKRAKPGEWPERITILEEAYTVEDALLIGGAMQALLNNADRVKVACFAQLVNCIAPIMTVDNGPAWRQTIFWPLSLASKYGHGQVLQQVVESPSYKAKTWHDVPYLLSTVINDPETGRTTIIAANRHLTETMDLTVLLKGLGEDRRISHTHELANDNLKAVNSADDPDNIVPSDIQVISLSGEKLTAQLKPASWNVIVIDR
ncbi:MAG TPA: alpha-L-arabinofuranosidase C-terminal domain-containing protein [Devosia sp.]|nr:alpha-L-arabinofuranosidase C-terminal domain-containing protein [Devosia sp.]